MSTNNQKMEDSSHEIIIHPYDTKQRKYTAIKHTPSEPELKTDMGQYLAERINWEDSDDIILINKLREVRGYKKLFTMAKLSYRKWDLIISFVSMFFAGIVTIISTASVFDGTSKIVSNVINIICGILTIFTHILEKILNYKQIETSSSKIVTLCIDMENEVNTILKTKREHRTDPTKVLQIIDDKYLNMVKSCTYIELSHKLIDQYKKEIIKEVREKHLPENEEIELLNAYIVCTGDTVV